MLQPSARVGVCPECEQNVPLEPVPGRRWGMPTVVAKHTAQGTRWCGGEGQKTLSRAKAWGWPVWERMSAYDRRVALMHVMECSSPVTAAIRKGHSVPYRDVRFAGLAHHQACVHAWDQTGGWQSAVERWGVEQVRAWVRGQVPVTSEEMPAFYGWGEQCQAYVEEGRVVGVLATRQAVRPKGWVWRRASDKVPVAVPDRRCARGRAVARHLMVVESLPRIRVGRHESDGHLGGAVRQAVRVWRPVEVEVDGVWAVFRPVMGQRQEVG